MQNGRTEVILFLPINHMNRFKSKTVGNDIKKDFLPLKKFVEQFGIKISEIEDDIALIKKIEQSLTTVPLKLTDQALYLCI